MARQISVHKRVVVAASIAAFAALAGVSAGQYAVPGGAGLISSAQAAEGDGGGGSSGGSGKAQHGSTGGHGTTHGSGKGKKDVMMKGQGGPGEDSDRPIWAGVKGGKAGAGTRPASSGTKKSDLYGDLWVILRDANGVPILNSAGQVQPIDANGNLIPLDAEGNPIDPTLVQTVEFSRLSVSRAPAKVLDHALNEAIATITAPNAVITLDVAGRIVVNGSVIDSPLENLALYKAVLTNTLPDNVKALLPANLSAASLLAGAADKTGTLTVDTVVYLNSILGINTVTNGVTTSYYDFSSVKYDRTATYENATVTVLVKQLDGSYLPTPVNIYDAVFSGSAWVDPTPTGGAADFAAEANDALRVIEFVHDSAAP